MSPEKVNTVLFLAKSKIGDIYLRLTRRGYLRAFDSQQSIYNGMADPVIVIGLDYRVKLMNRAAQVVRKRLRDMRMVSLADLAVKA